MTYPSLSELEASNWDFLTTSAENWRKLAHTWENAFTEVRNGAMHPGGTEWAGPAAEAYQHRTDTDLMTVRGPVNQLRDAADIAVRGRDQQEAGKKLALDAVDEARRAGFHVADAHDYSVTDTKTSYDSDAERDARATEAKEHHEFINYRMNNLVSGEGDLNRDLTRAAQGLDTFSFGDEDSIGDAGADDGQPDVQLVDAVLKPGESRNLGPVAGTGADPGIPGIGAADLGEVITLPDGSKVAIFGDSFSGNKMGAGDHYPSVAVPVTFDAQGHPHFGAPLTGPAGSGHELFAMPQAAKDAGANDTLPAGSFQVNGQTYMMVSGTKDLKPVGGSWLVKATNDFSKPWEPVPGSWQPGTYANGGQSQISGFQSSKDGKVYIAADSFDRSHGVTMYQFDPAHGGSPTDRSTWQPWTGNGWGDPHQAAVPVTPPATNFGELSFREIGGSSVLSGFNASNGPGSVETRIANSPTDIFNSSTSTVVAQGGNWGVPGKVPQNYGGYILPGSTLDDMRLFVSQWNTNPEANGVPYVVEQFQVNPNR
jgi:hypothetical protein